MDEKDRGRDFEVTTSDGVHLSATRFGEGRDNAILMIPGMGASRAVFGSLREALGDELTYVTFDPRGVSRSDAPDGPYSMDRLARDAVDVIHGAGLERCVVLGASMGGLVAQYVGVLHPESVTALILCCTHPGYRVGVVPPKEVDDALLGRGATTAEDAYRRATAVLYSDRFRRNHPDVLERHIKERMANPVRARAFQAHYRSAREADVFERLPLISVNTLVLHGQGDRVVPLANARLLAGRIPQALLRVHPWAGHLFFHEDPEWTAAAIHEFCAHVVAHGTPLSQP